MNETNFTPGPWRVTAINKDRIWINDERSPLRARIAIIDDAHGIDDPMANANLIAAAPDMYEMLESILEECRDFGNPSHPGDAVYQQIETVLKKARGEK